MKRMISLLLAIVLTLCAAFALAAGAKLQTAGSYDALLRLATGVAIPDAPQGATDISYLLIEGDTPIAQIAYTWNGVQYHLRAAVCVDAENVEDVSGMGALFGNTAPQKIDLAENQSYELTVRESAMRASWFDEAKLCEYALFASKATDEASFRTAVEELYKRVQETEAVHQKGVSVSGTVKQISKTSITLVGKDQKTYRFTITKDTVRTTPQKIATRAVVLVNYVGAYQDKCDAVSITLLQDAKGNKGGKKKPRPTATPKPDKEIKAKGTVTLAVGNCFEVKTNNETLPFLIEDAKVTGVLEVGAKASVVYNIRNGMTHLISVAFTHVDPTPEPTPTPTPAPEKHTINGTIVQLYGVFLTVADASGYEYDFDLTGARIGGDSGAQEGDSAKVVFYYDDEGDMVVTSCTFTIIGVIDPYVPDEPDVPDVSDDFEDFDFTETGD